MVGIIQKFIFRSECPNGKLSRSHLLQLFSKVFPQGNAESFCEHIFRFDYANFLVKEIVRKESRLKSNVFPKEYCSESDFF